MYRHRYSRQPRTLLRIYSPWAHLCPPFGTNSARYLSMCISLNMWVDHLKLMSLLISLKLCRRLWILLNWCLQQVQLPSKSVEVAPSVSENTTYQLHGGWGEGLLMYLKPFEFHLPSHSKESKGNINPHHLFGIFFYCYCKSWLLLWNKLILMWQERKPTTRKIFD